MHEECYYERNTKKNKNELCPLCYSGMESTLTFGGSSGSGRSEVKPYRYRMEVDELELLRSKMNKMNYYDRTAQVMGLEQWGQF